MLSIKGYCRSPETKKLVMWETAFTKIEHLGEIEMLLHEITKEAERTFKKTGFKGPALALIETVKETPVDLPLLKA